MTWDSERGRQGEPESEADQNLDKQESRCRDNAN